ncbi:alpha/beta hydrolase-fold protein [Bacillus sp. AFS015802]|uniref:alpha/beta hydrolase-fold protein n=1 Tax=Bacillus sp. AFS015802 TaxID=2033486 RepID=UPI0015CEFC8E|nr:alpha/beta hydrolase-fold protein [Bacillus sp. AFS015802]
MISNLEEHQISSQILGKKQLYYSLEVQEGERQAVDVLYVQDGEDYVRLGKLQDAWHDILKEEGRRDVHCLLILVPPSTSEERYHYYHPSGTHHDKYIHFFHQELVPFIEKQIRETGKDIRKKGLLGDSLGAAVCLALASEEPKEWTHLLLQSGAFNDFHANKIRNIETKTPWNVYQVVGSLEESVTYPLTGETFPILSANRTLYEKLQLIADHHTYHEEDEDHLWDFWRRDLPRALHYFLTKG